MVRVVISMVAVKSETGVWRSDLYCYEDDDGDGVRLANEATDAIRQALSHEVEAGGKPFNMGRPPQGSIPLWDVWVGTKKVSRNMWAETCDYRKHPGCPQAMVAKMMEAYKILCADCGNKRKRGKKHA